MRMEILEDIINKEELQINLTMMIFLNGITISEKQTIIKNMKKECLILAIFALFVLNSCNQRSKINTNPLTVDAKIEEENFDEFSKLFYSDSLFQLSRISFPLSGIHNIEVEESPSNESGDSIIHEWIKENWIILKKNSFQGNDSVKNIDGEIYKRKTKKTELFVCDSVYIEDSGFGIVKKFAIKNGKWYLISYSEYNY